MVEECKKERVRRPKQKVLSIEKGGKGFALAAFGLTKEEALKEAQRCLGLRECESCEVCSLLCPISVLLTEREQVRF